MRFMIGVHIGAQRYMDVYKSAWMCAEVCGGACRGMWRGAWRYTEGAQRCMEVDGWREFFHSLIFYYLSETRTMLLLTQ